MATKCEQLSSEYQNNANATPVAAHASEELSGFHGNYSLLPLYGGLPKKKSSCIKAYTLIVVLLAAFHSVMAGYCLGSINGAVLFMRKDLSLTQFQQEMLVSSLVLVSTVGNFIAGSIAGTIGRKRTMAVASSVTLLGYTLVAISPNFWLLFFAMIVSSIAVGLIYVIVPLYVAEISPPKVRGMLLSLPEIHLNVGILLGYLSGDLLSGFPENINWRIMFLLGDIPAIILLFAVWLMPESPRWLVLRRRVDQATTILRRTLDGNQEELDHAVAEIIDAATVDQANHRQPQSLYEHRDDLISDSEKAPLLKNDQDEQKINVNPLYELLCPSMAVGKVMLVAMALQFFNQASGESAVLYYTPTIFKDAGFRSQRGSLGATVIVGITKTSCILINTVLVDRIGRRPLLMASGLGMAVSMTSLGASLLLVQNSAVDHHATAHSNPLCGLIAVLSACCFMASYSVGSGPLNTILLSEIFPLKLRAQGVGLAMVVNRFFGGIVSLFFLTVSSAITPAKTVFAFALVAGISPIFVHFCVPETRGKELEDASMCR